MGREGCIGGILRVNEEMMGSAQSKSLNVLFLMIDVIAGGQDGVRALG